MNARPRSRKRAIARALVNLALGAFLPAYLLFANWLVQVVWR